MDRDIKSPLSSMLMSSQVFQNTSSSPGNRISGVTGTKDNIYIVPQRRSVALNPDIKDNYTSAHSLKVNKSISKVPWKSEELGNDFFVSEGNFSNGKAILDNQVAGKLLIPYFVHMKATCGQRTNRTGHSSSYRPLSLNNSCYNSLNSRQDDTLISVNSYMSEMLQPLRGSPQKLNPLIQRDKLFSLSYKELHNGQAPHRYLNNNDSMNYNVPFRYKLNKFDANRSPRSVNKVVVNGEKNEESEKGGEQIEKEVKALGDINSRPATTEEATSGGDGDSQWNDDDYDDDGSMSYVDDEESAFTNGSDNDDIEVATDEVQGKTVNLPQNNRIRSAAPPVVNQAPSGGREIFSATKKPVSPAPISRIRAAQQEQQRRLRDTVGFNKSRPNTGSVIFNGSLHQNPPSNTQQSRLTALPKQNNHNPRSIFNNAVTAYNKPSYDNRSLDSDLAPFKRRSSNVIGLPATDGKTLQPLQPSLFSNVPPTLVFGTEENTVLQLPKELRHLLRWKTSTITPNVLKKILSKSNFKLTQRDEVWIGCWAKHMKQDMFRALKDFQKFNHYPASFQIGRKDRLWRNLSAMQVRFGRKEFNFFPHTFVLPADYKQLKRIMEDSEKRQRWILKPPASARGNGIRCVSSVKQVPKKRPVIVQKYIHQPYLINESKFDIRLYVYVACYDPLKAYIYSDGLARFASTKYSSSMRDLPNKYMHLTNYSINKHNTEYQSNKDEDAQTGHKWSLHAMWDHFRSPISEEEGIANKNFSQKSPDIDQIWQQIKDIVLKTLISTEHHVVSAVKMNVVNRYAVHELFGVDVLLDRELKPWLIEFNISPSLHSDSPLDYRVKGGMLKDLLNLAGFRLPNPNVVRSGNMSEDNSIDNGSKSSYFDSRLVSSALSVDEKNKHSYYTQNWRSDAAMKTILDIITPDDLRILLEFEDERSRLGNFEPLFPLKNGHRYLKYFDTIRYYNLLLEAWLRTYGEEVDENGKPINRHEKGLEMLESFCRRGIHLENPTNDWRHIWKAPNLSPAALAPNNRSNGSNGVVAQNSSSSNPDGSSSSRPLASNNSQSLSSMSTQVE